MEKEQARQEELARVAAVSVSHSAVAKPSWFLDDTDSPKKGDEIEY